MNLLMKCSFPCALLIALSLSSCSVVRSETAHSLTRRFENWGVKLPEDSTLLAKHYRSYLGWNKPEYFHVYCAFSFQEEPADLLSLFTAPVDQETKNRWDIISSRLWDGGHVIDRNVLPDFDGESFHGVIFAFSRASAEQDADPSSRPAAERVYVPCNGYDYNSASAEEGLEYDYEMLDVIYQPSTLRLFACFDYV